MDINKLKKLRDIKYKIMPCCGICIFGNFENSKSMWGSCLKHKYSHNKHTDDPMSLSITRYGCCGEKGFEFDEESHFGYYLEFMEK